MVEDTRRCAEERGKWNTDPHRLDHLNHRGTSVHTKKQRARERRREGGKTKYSHKRVVRCPCATRLHMQKGGVEIVERVVMEVVVVYKLLLTLVVEARPT